jgi:hypothetical protein
MSSLAKPAKPQVFTDWVMYMSGRYHGTKTPALVYSAVVLSPNYDPLTSHKFPWFEHCTTLKFDGDN